ncbi:MAG: hypothetical protein MHM6MM_000107 [Cercozoa sp. M6MM]
MPEQQEQQEVQQGQEAVHLESLSLEELVGLRKNCETSLEMLSTQLSALRGAAARFTSASKAVVGLRKAPESSEMLVPMTTSLFMPGKVADVDELLLDVGTGFFLGKSTEDAQEYLAQRIAILQDRIKGCAGELQNKQSLMAKIDELVELRWKERQQQQQQQQQTAA